MPSLARVVLFALFPLLAFAGTDARAQVYDIREYSAAADGKTLSTSAIQQAIDECTAAGGGEVRVPAGQFLTGTLFLKSNVVLRLMPGAVLQGSGDVADYPEHDISRHNKFGTITHDGAFVRGMRSLVIADGVENVAIVGEGAIRGAGEAEPFQLGVNKDGKPKNLFFIGCRDVRLSGIRVFNAAQVTVSISGCDRVTLDGIYLHSMTNFNCDGIDIDARDVVVSNCIIESEDDALCFKSEYLDRFCENVTVQNCVVASICNGLKLGTGSRAGFRNITVSNCVVRRPRTKAVLHEGHIRLMPDIGVDPETPSVLTGIVILGVDGGVVENIRFSHIVMTDVLSPIFIRAGRRFLNPQGKPSVVRNISIEHVTAECRSAIPTIIAGLEDSPVRDIRLSDIRVTVPIGITKSQLADFPESPKENVKGYPENRLTFGYRLPASAVYVRHAEQVSLRDVVVTTGPDEARPAVVADDVRGLELRDFRINAEPLKEEAVRRIQSAGVEIVR